MKEQYNYKKKKMDTLHFKLRFNVMENDSVTNHIHVLNLESMKAKAPEQIIFPITQAHGVIL